jgi:DNA-binding SARP family transcriptional activator
MLQNLTGGGQAFELCIHLLGDFQVRLRDRTLSSDQFRLRKTRALIKLLSLANNHRLHRDQVIETLWPDRDISAANNSFHQVVYQTRRVLDPEGEFADQLLVQRDEFLHLGQGISIQVDIESFESAAHKAQTSKEPDDYQAALDLYQGDLLDEDRYEAWVSERRDDLRKLCLQLLLELSNVYEAQKEYAKAVPVIQRALCVDPSYEEAHISLMRLYALTGHRQMALRQYQLLQDSLCHELDAEPDAKAKQLYQDILDGRFPEPAEQ